MKTKFITSIGILMSVWLMSSMNAIAATCNDAVACAAGTTKRYCCADRTETTYYCGYSGWILLSNKCYCPSYSDSDSTGKYTVGTGETIDASTTTKVCYEPSTSSVSSYNGAYCYPNPNAS